MRETQWESDNEEIFCNLVGVIFRSFYVKVAYVHLV